MIYMNYDSLNDDMMISNSNISIANLKSIYPQLLRQLYTREYVFIYLIICNYYNVNFNLIYIYIYI